MRYCQIHRNFGYSEYLCRLSKDYLMHWHATFILSSTQKFAKFWRITRLSTTNPRKVINSQKWSSFFGPPCIASALLYYRGLCACFSGQARREWPKLCWCAVKPYSLTLWMWNRQTWGCSEWAGLSCLQECDLQVRVGVRASVDHGSKHHHVLVSTAFTGWSKKCQPPSFTTSQLRRILTDLRSSFTGTLSSKFSIKWRLEITQISRKKSIHTRTLNKIRVWYARMIWKIKYTYHTHWFVLQSTLFAICLLVGATENAGPGKCRTWKMTDQIAGLENTRPNHFASNCVLFHSTTKSYQTVYYSKCVMPKNR